jgi:phosphohistidine swiveling domain-containing protein
MKLSSKAQTLNSLKIKGAIIPKLKIYSCNDFLQNEKKIVNDIIQNFKSKIAIRSSSQEEDQFNKSNAGKYSSFLNVDIKNYWIIKDKINEVINSYKKNKHNQVFFIQEMVNEIKISGVLLTRNLENYSKCININYHVGSDSSVVTSGKENTKNLIFVPNSKFKIDNRFNKLLRITYKLIATFNEEDLDLEFAIDKKNKIYILQVRKLIVPKKFLSNTLDLRKIYTHLGKKINKLQKKHYSLRGASTFFGVMTDWNPAEIIGIKPKPLALSLYRELVTDHVWSENRKIYGYRDLSQFHLMTTFYGTPFIDIRIDFNSWLPKELPNKLSEKIINIYLKDFKSKQYLHDKVEFEILFTCYTLDTEKKINTRFKTFLTLPEKKILINSLKKINFKALKQIKNDLNCTKELIKRQNLIKKSSLYYIDKVYWLLEDCKKYGTLSFAGIARCAFISTDILNSFVNEKIFTENDRLKFLSSIKTITSELNEDILKDKKEFINKYGHLRPGTYEITSLNYKTNFKNYFGGYSKSKKIYNDVHEYKFSQKQKVAINKFIKKTKIYKNFEDLISFIKNSIKYREYSKFIFSKNIDMIFENLESFGKKFDLKKDDLSYLNINTFLDLYFNFSSFKSVKSLKKNIKENKTEYIANQKIILPDVITSEKDLFLQVKKKTKVNFISNKIITAKLFEYKEINIRKKINGIVCIENADPGYDFLFTKNIKGLITKYGGQNSHMAIRCAELNLPALIGVGDEAYKKIIKNKSIKIDCVLRKIDLIA